VVIAKAQVILPSNLREHELQIALKYFESAGQLTSREWKTALSTFDALRKGVVMVGRRRMTFQQVYDRYVDLPYADSFIAQLTELPDLNVSAEMLQRETSFEVLTALERQGFYQGESEGSEYLAAYCLYWWTSFARGYRFELEVLRDLTASGIKFIAHDVQTRTGRLSPYDLVVLRQRGDIKNTTYFLHLACTLPSNCDFYITRLFDLRVRRYLPIVVMTEAAWRILDGDVPTASLEMAAGFFPKPVKFTVKERRFIVAPYDLWKAMVKKQQEKEAQP
jgi:hypothetical protein